MQFYANRLAEWCNAGDPICCHTGKDLNEHNSYFTSGDNLAVLNFVRKSVGLSTYPQLSQPSLLADINTDALTSGSLGLRTHLADKLAWLIAAACLVGAIISAG